MAGGKENQRDMIELEKWDYLGKNNQREKDVFLGKRMAVTVWTSSC